MNYHNQQHQNHQRRRFIPPQVGSIHRATVTRLESYGCFVKFTPSPQSIPISGLVHISQLIPLSSNNGNKLTVEDVVSLNDNVYIKVMDVTLEPPNENGRQRHKVKLSMKYVHQDTGQDLDVDGTLMEEDLLRQRQRSNNNNGSNGGDANLEGTGGANSLLGRALATNIGMSSAIDPGTLILKGRRGSNSTGGGGGVQFNGYSLVGEEEGGDDITAAAPSKSVRDDGAQNNVVRPMGRGRATTLPAWMTRQDAASNDDKLGSMKGEDGPGKDNDDNNSYSSRRGDRHRKKSSRRDKHKERKHHKRHHRSSSRKHGRKHKKSSKRRKHRSQSRGRSSSASYYYSSSSDDNHHDDYSRSRSRSPSYRRKKSKSKHHRRRHRRDRDDYSRSRSRSRSAVRQGRRSSSPPAAFSNVEEARAIMERLERRRHRED